MEAEGEGAPGQRRIPSCRRKPWHRVRIRKFAPQKQLQVAFEPKSAQAQDFDALNALARRGSVRVSLTQPISDVATSIAQPISDAVSIVDMIAVEHKVRDVLDERGGKSGRHSAPPGVGPRLETLLESCIVAEGGGAKFECSVAGTAPLITHWSVGSSSLVTHWSGLSPSDRASDKLISMCAVVLRENTCTLIKK